MEKAKNLLVKFRNNWEFVLLAVFVGVGVFGLIYQEVNREKPQSPVVNSPSDVVQEDLAPIMVNTQASIKIAKFLTVPEQFQINLFAGELGKVRVLAQDLDGNLYATIQDQGKVVAFKDKDLDGVADLKIDIITGLNNPHGLQIACPSDIANCYLFVAEVDKVTRYELNPNDKSVTNPKQIVQLPAGGQHITRSILIKNSYGINYLYVSVGSSCNVCKEEDEKRASILRVEISSGKTEIFASGLRNSVFLKYDPLNGNIYATEMGRDWLGDNIPPDEINLIVEGGFYGWPYCYGNSVRDMTYNSTQEGEDKCAEARKPVVEIPAHSAPLGIEFMPLNNPWGDYLNRTVFVAYHGSWNREDPIGYKIVRYTIDKNGQFSAPEDFVEGFMSNTGEVLGRPVDMLFGYKGEMFISDDKEGRIYRVVKK